jgi:hypothetical protein
MYSCRQTKCLDVLQCLSLELNFDQPTSSQLSSLLRLSNQLRWSSELRLSDRLHLYNNPGF